MKLLEGGMSDGLVKYTICLRRPTRFLTLHHLHSEAMDQVGAKRYCCRRMLMTHVDLIEKLLQYVDYLFAAQETLPRGAMANRLLRRIDTILRNED
jgi:DNA-directed RNA polymerase subunit N (RpoN/RPB10)